MRVIATATLSGNLTREVELRKLPSGTDVARIRVATTTRRRNGEEWIDAPVLNVGWCSTTSPALPRSAGTPTAPQGSESANDVIAPDERPHGPPTAVEAALAANDRGLTNASPQASSEHPLSPGVGSVRSSV